MDLKLISLHHIYENNNYVSKDLNINDGQEYISNLVTNIESSNETREYEINSDTTEVINLILSICKSFESFEEAAISDELKKDNSSNFSMYFDKIVERLILCQKNVQEKRKAMNKPQKGNVIQVLIEEENSYNFIISLIDSKRFIDDDDLRYKSGMIDGKENTLKAAKLSINKNTYKFTKILLYDSHKKMAQYWYDQFLELKEKRSDRSNTNFAFQTINNVLSSTLSVKFKTDFTELKNATAIYFLHNEVFRYTEFVDYLLESYKPIDEGWNKADLIDKLNENNVKNIFDNQFSIDYNDIKNKLINAKYTINSNIELKVKKPVDNMKDSIYTEKLSTGENVIILRNVEEKTLERFNFNKIDL